MWWQAIVSVTDAGAARKLLPVVIEHKRRWKPVTGFSSTDTQYIGLRLPLYLLPEPYARLSFEIAADPSWPAGERSAAWGRVEDAIKKVRVATWAHRPGYPACIDPAKIRPWLAAQITRKDRFEQDWEGKPIPAARVVQRLLQMMRLLIDTGQTDALEFFIDQLDSPDAELSGHCRKFLVSRCGQDLGAGKQRWRAWAAARYLPLVRAAAHKRTGCGCTYQKYWELP